MRVRQLRPLLPPAGNLLPYLQRIDSSRIYSNWGPLVEELTIRLEAHWDITAGMVMTASSGTAALVGAILAAAGRSDARQKYAVTQSMTFVGTLSAIEQCGFEAKLLDVNRQTWSLEPADVEALPDLDRIGVVVPVAAYGRPICMKAWQEFMRRTEVPVVVDAAACFDTLSDLGLYPIGSIPLAISFHATKFFSTGEGGCVICKDLDVVERTQRALNFGFFEDRSCRSASINGKMSEYSAAIGLASLDGLKHVIPKSDAMCQVYQRLFADIPGYEMLTWPSISRAYALLYEKEVARVSISDELQRFGIEHRRWYGSGLHRQPYIEERHDRARYPVTDALCASLIGMPVAWDFSTAEIGVLENFATTLRERLRYFLDRYEQ